MKKIVLINRDFKDAYTGKLHKAGEKCKMTEQRVAEVKGVNPDLISVIGSVEEPADSDAAAKVEATKGKTKSEEPAEGKNADTEATKGES